MLPALFLESVGRRELVVNQFCQMVGGGVTVEARRFCEPLPVYIRESRWRPLVFRAQVVM